VACALDLIGDRWTLLVIRDLFLGRTRFRDFSQSPEGIPTNILSERLARLVAHQIAEQVPAEDGTKRRAYRLTARGRDLLPVLENLRDWGLKWEKGTRVMRGEPIPHPIEAASKRSGKNSPRVSRAEKERAS
jgi:DNA-binding HxlR family transcriptional regulator